jgi:hypothetical protein
MSTVITDKELGRGLDAYHPETKLDEGFVPYIQNLEPTHSGSMKLRRGYQRVGGYMPVRVLSAVKAPFSTDLVVKVDPGIKLQITDALIDKVRPFPVVIYSRLYKGTPTPPDEVQEAPSSRWYGTCTVTDVDELTISLSNNSGELSTYSPGATPTNDPAVADVDMWIWGLPLDETYGDGDVDRTLWINSMSGLDTQGEDTLVASFNGQLMRLSNVSTYGALFNMPATTAGDIRRVTSDTVLGPAFHNVAPSPMRTRGAVVTGAAFPDNYLDVTSITYDHDTGYTTYLLKATGRTVIGTPIELGDVLTVEQCSWAALDGRHKVIDVTYPTDAVSVVVRNLDNQKADARISDPTGGRARAAVQSDRLETTPTTVPLFTGDVVQFGASTGIDNYVVVQADTTPDLHLDVITELRSLLADEGIYHSRISRIVVPDELEGFVRGDVIYTPTLSRGLTVRTVWPFPSTLVSVSCSGLRAVITLPNAAPYIEAVKQFRVGDHIQIIGGTDLDGTHEIDDISYVARQLTVSSTATGVTSATMVGQYLALDEVWTYGATDPVVVSERWSPVQPAGIPKKQMINRLFNVQPVTAGLGTLDGSTIPIPSVAQARARIYLSNGDDPMATTEGQTLVSAGHFLTNPIIAIDVTTNHPNPIQNPYSTISGITVISTTLQTCEIAVADKSKFAVGEYITLANAVSYGGGDFMFHTRVKSVETSTTAGQATITFTAPAPSTGVPALTRLYKTVSVRYTGQWVALDESGNAAASLCPQVKDLVVAFGPPSVINLKLALYPALHKIAARYSALEFRLYRAGGGLDGDLNTPAGQQTDWTWIASIPFNYIPNYVYQNGQDRVATAASSAYIQYTDNAQIGATASALPLPLDITSGNNMGENWEMPPRGRAIAVASNVLAVANYRGWDEHLITLRPLSETTSAGMDKMRVIIRRELEALDPGQPNNVTQTTSLKGTQAYQFLRVNGPGTAATERTSLSYVQYAGVYVEGLYNGGLSTAGASLVIFPVNLTSLADTLTNFLYQIAIAQGQWIYAGVPVRPGYTDTGATGMDGWHMSLSDAPLITTLNSTFSAPGVFSLSYTSGTPSYVPAFVGAMKGQLSQGIATFTSISGSAVYLYQVTAVSESIAGVVNTVTFTCANLGVIPPINPGDSISIPVQRLYIPSPQRQTLSMQCIGGSQMISAKAHGLSVGSPLIYNSTTQRTATSAPDIVPGRQLYARPISDTAITLHSSISDAISGTAPIPIPTNSPGPVPPPIFYNFTVDQLHAAGTTTTSAAQHRALYIYKGRPYSNQTTDDIYDVPVPVGDSGSATAGTSNYTRFTGSYSSSLDAPLSSALIQTAITALSRAINCVSSATQDQLYSSSADTIIPQNTPVGEQTWLTADSGSLYSPGTLKVRSTEPISVQISGAINNGGVAKFQWLVANGTPYNTFAVELKPSYVGAAVVTQPGHGLLTGTAVVVRHSNGGTLPAGLQHNWTYFAVRYNDTKFALALTEQDALNGIVINFPASADTVFLMYVEPIIWNVPRYTRSRLSLSYPNYPEIHAGSYDDVQSADNRIVDVNPDDGEEIETIYPFYGDSFSKASLQEDRLVVFKRSNVYLVNVNTREVTRVQTYGHGAEFPRTVTDTKNGLIFADRTGIYKLNRSSDIPFTGEYIGRIWDDGTGVGDVDRELPVAMHDAIHNQVRVSVPSAGEASNDLTFVYDHKRESGDEKGAWTMWTGYRPISWFHFQGYTYHGGRYGLAYIDRYEGTATDYRDDDQEIPAYVQFRPSDFGVSGSRKNLVRAVVQFRRTADMEISGVQVSAATDMAQYFVPCDPFALRYNPVNTGIAGDRTSPVIYSISFSVPVRKAEFHQIALAVAVKDQPLEITQITYHVDLLTTAGTPEAGET